MSGWICLHRKLLDHWIYDEPEALKVWITMLMEANHENKKRMFNGSLIEVKRGELICGRLSLSERTGISERKVRRYLDLLEDEGMIVRQKFPKYSLVTITKYSEHQDRVQQTSSIGPASVPQPVQQTPTPKQLNNYNNTSSPEDLACAQSIFEGVLRVAPKTKTPNLQKWANTIRLMRERDSLTLEEISAVFAWANNDSFWSLNILSPAKLREQFPRLSAQRQRGNQQGSQADEVFYQ